MKEPPQPYLERLKAWHWPDGIRCPRCRAARWSLHARADRDGGPKYRCAVCMRTFNALTGTPFARSRLPLKTWFVCGARLRQGPATCAELARRLGVKVTTAWRMRRVLQRSLSAADLEALFGDLP